ncbi:MAG: adenylate/guanylate cyclase domain-containing protein [Alphaproteobacteria bacterium]|nr:adenylate/guanylate cyclase domain-containing protein [Alphaproteobacteria bacterium]
MGPSTKPLPSDAKYAVRLLDDSSGERADSFIIYSDWGNVTQVLRGPPHYDPRQRPWYRNARKNPDVSLSKAYVFASSKLVGVTVSHRVETQNGVEIGAVGADITLDTLSSFLKAAKIGDSGLVFILDEDGRLLAHPDPNIGVRVDGDTVQLLSATNVSDPLVSDAVKAWKSNGAQQLFEAPLGPNGDLYLTSFTSLSDGPGPNWTVAVIVLKDELIGPLRNTSFQILAAGGVFILIAMFAIFILSRKLTEPLQEIVSETNRIRSFELDHEFSIQSAIVEIDQLGQAVETMKRSLRSFSIYVPKELVRAIVSDAGEAALGSRRQPLTLMFTDIRGFTNASEAMSPEGVVTSLSQYFERMSTAIHSTNGIVDKFIGDAIMAIWNAPLIDANHVKHGCETLLTCLKIDKTLADEFVNAGVAPFFTRFGLHTGDAVVGNVGSSERFQYSAFGNVVNIAARLESLNKTYGTQPLVSGEVVTEAEDTYVFRFLDKVVPVGATHPIFIYELIGARDENSPVAATLERLVQRTRWEDCRKLYDEHQWRDAREAFIRYKELFADTVAADLMIERCDRFLETPPPSDWDGAEWLNGK